MSRLDTRSRFPIEPAWPNGGMVSKPLGERNYDVQQSTGYSHGTVPGSNWNRGVLYRGVTVELRPTREPTMYDPTDPNTWPTQYKR